MRHRCCMMVAVLMAAAVLTLPRGPGEAAAKPKPQQPTVLGTTQLPGQWAAFGKTYTLGKSSPWNFTLLRAEFACGRVKIGAKSFVPDAQTKLLVLHYTVQNPRKTERGYGWADISVTAVDAEDTNHEFCEEVGNEKDSSSVSVDLKPAQKLACYTLIEVPAKGPVPKLIVQGNDNLVLRYDLRGKVARLPPPYADPADETGVSALAEVPAEVGVYYPTGTFDMKVTGFTHTTESLGDEDPPEGGRFLVIHLTVKNPQAKEQGFSWGDLDPEVRTSDGDRIAYNEELLHRTRNEDASLELRPGEEQGVRVYFPIPPDAQPQTFTLREDEDKRGFVYQVTAGD